MGEAVIIEIAFRVHIQNRIGAELPRIDHAGEGPGFAAVFGISEAGLPEIAADVVELPPADNHAIRIGGIDSDGRFVGRIVVNVVAVFIHVYLGGEENIVAPGVRGRCFPVLVCIGFKCVVDHFVVHVAFVSLTFDSRYQQEQQDKQSCSCAKVVHNV